MFGIPALVHNAEEYTAMLASPDGPRIMIVARCADVPRRSIPEPIRSRNRRSRCERCEQLCWYDPEHAVPGMRLLCSHCAPAQVVAVASEALVTELRRVVGDG